MKVNNVVLVGNLTRDPEAGSPGNGVVANMGLAIDNTWKDGEGNVVSGKPNFIDVEAWGQQGQHCLDTLNKGDRVILIGPLQFSQWTDDAGNDRSKHRVRARVIGKSLEFASE